MCRAGNASDISKVSSRVEKRRRGRCIRIRADRSQADCKRWKSDARLAPSTKWPADGSFQTASRAVVASAAKVFAARQIGENKCVGEIRFRLFQPVEVMSDGKLIGHITLAGRRSAAIPCGDVNCPGKLAGLRAVTDLSLGASSRRGSWAFPAFWRYVPNRKQMH
jgi:hypothetical protein